MLGRGTLCARSSSQLRVALRRFNLRAYGNRRRPNSRRRRLYGVAEARFGSGISAAMGTEPHEAVMKYPLEVQGELIGAQLMVVGFPRERVLKFRLGILFPAMICRLDYTDETHANSVDGMVLAGSVPPIVQGPHYHAWPLSSRRSSDLAKSNNIKVE